MLRTTFLSLLLFVSLSSSTSLLRKSISRRQTEPEYCQAIEGFDCKCSPYRVTCTSDRVLPAQINVLQNEKQKYPSVELIINGEHAQNVYEYTFEPVKQLYKPDADSLEFRIKFEKYTALHLSSPGIFNKVFPDSSPANTRKQLGLEIYNPLVQPDDNVNLFANLNVDALELYVVYPFRGTFQQLFTGANIKYLRLSGGDIRSDLSQPFTGNIGRLELAKQASQISVQNFPIYPAHELIINAFYVTDFNSDNPPNYSNLGELRIHSQESVPANAFRQYSNLHTLSISTEKNIDPHAFDGLYNLEKLTIKDTKPSLELLNNLQNLKELEISLEKLNDKEQCQLVEKLANGQLAVQAIPNAHQCTCAAAYLDTASGRYPCDAPSCDQSSCAAIKTNYDASTRTFKAPPTIKRADGSDALRQPEPKVYTAPFQISNQDREKFQQGASQPQQEQQQQQPSGQEGDGEQSQSDSVTQPGQSKKSRRTKPRTPTTTTSFDQQQNAGEQGQYQPYQPENQPRSNSEKENERYSSVDQNESTNSTNSDEKENKRSKLSWDYPNDYEDLTETTTFFDRSDGLITSSKIKGDDAISDTNDDPNVQQGEANQGEDGESLTQNEGTENQQDKEGTENQPDGHSDHEHHQHMNSNQSTEAVGSDVTDIPPPKKGMSWLPIIIIIAAIAALLLIGLIILIIRKRRARGYTPTATGENVTARA